MERRTSEDLGLKRPNNYPICTTDFYGDAARFWQPFASKNPSSMGMRMFPFTTAQWQELQRQALIYKHIMASVPVPPDLLLPSAARSFPETSTIFLPPAPMVVGRGGGISLRFANGSTDPEPGRCRRTDGKKWRCARDAAPDQKYCERHLLRGRPRSRKPVEQRRTRCKSNDSVVASGSSISTASTAKGKSPAAADSGGGAVGVVPNIELNLPFQAMEPIDQEPSECPTSNSQWGTAEQHYDELPNLNYRDARDNWCPFLNPNLASLDENRVADYSEPPRRFIDAWSSENMDATATTSNQDDPSLFCRDKLHLSTLTLSMSNAAEDEADNTIRSQPLMNWMSSDSPLGGPLAEVLNQSSSITSPRDSVNTCSSNKNNRADLINLMGRSCASREASPRDSPSRALVSSPSGVLQKALVSLSDSSSSSSPTFAAAASRSDFAFHWMKLNN